jgi:putative heme-binding domain-containing protein
VAFANAPDGCLWFCDMYRETIEHPWSLPEPLKKNLDLNSGNDRGRIYRIVPVNFKARPLPRLGGLPDAELVASLDHANGWHRDTAARLLHQRGAGAEAIAKLVAARTPAVPDLGTPASVKAVPALNLPKASPREDAWRAFRPALAMRGDAAKGRAIFDLRCAMCHRLGGRGSVVGPDLDAARQAGREKVLGNIIEPSREITAGYALGILELKDGTTVSGILANESAAGVVLRLPGAAERAVKSAEIAKLSRPAQSLMPDGIEGGLTVREMADLLELLAGP